ncbi:hypothetical protein [Couchioplanes caeruleus]|uniref:Uncharacterized protein n=2 Tax=Couchioplanes caeruleus TaxID=56438 RepID=A0A1K0GJY3_9ACTN|nr:hypothetical protein [Couchioplanes caeruleus]OJF12582.1 hypothetical protein BG844_19860 [Couchioplanes caeruleus subsp. caeruleus]ROP33515.1 hypothetical protein EDD30_6502 [Couchioplanes caeruleus]
MADELFEMAHGNPKLARALHENLQTLADHGNEKLREMAGAVLDGGSLRELALSDTYGEEIGSAFDTFWHRYQAMPSEERAELDSLARERFYEAPENY